VIDDAQARRFREHGFLVVPDLLAGDELDALRRETLALVESAVERRGGPDVQYKRHDETGEEVPFRIEYVVDKTPACRALLGHPFVLRIVEKLQGPDFVPTWDSMVFKLGGAGAAIPWHRDELIDYAPTAPIFNVDFYLDASDSSNCLWAIPGSHRWSNAEVRAEVERLGRDGFQREGVPLELQPGDVLLHDILVVHGSPPARSGLRRVLYYEFRPVELELEVGPHVPEYVLLKQAVLAACIRERAEAPYTVGEEPYVYAGGAGLDRPATYRYTHERYLRSRPG
jgi:phytanoyl-CoA hydroxylase